MVNTVAITTDRHRNSSLVGVVQAAYIPENHTSLLPCYYIREAGWRLSDIHELKGGEFSSETSSLIA